jgi:group II intron reverse transcriptase/maturase
VEDEGIAAVLTTPENIRTLQRKLYRKAKQEPGYRFYALYDKVCRGDILRHAYDLVRANRGSAGIDGVTFEVLEADEGVPAFLAELKEALKEKTYRASPVKRVMIPKSNGKERPLGIPTIRDRVAQMAVKLVIEPIFEADFCSSSFGFRPGKSAHDAIDVIAQAMHEGHNNVIDADLSQYFDTIPHAKLMTTVAQRISDGGILHLIQMWLKAPVIEEDKNGKRRNVGGGKNSRRGTPQGGVLSPLLANIYLHILDRVWERHHLAERLEARLVRYADDFVVLCRAETGGAMQIIKDLLDRMDLALNEDKTRVVNAWKERFCFLGFELGIRRSTKSGKPYPHVQPSKRSLQRIRTGIKALTGRNRTCLPLSAIMTEVNQQLRGWTGYFHYRNCSRSMVNLKGYVEERLRTHLRKRHKIRSRGAGYARFPQKVLYTRYGLYKVPTTAGWTIAHASR